MEPAGESFGVKRLLLVLVSAILILVIWIYITSPMVVTVTGVGQVSAPASNYTVSFTLTANGDNPLSAISKVNDKAQAMRTFLTKIGVPSDNIAESEVTTVPSNLVVAGATGYQATISMAAKTANTGNSSTLVSDLYSNGASIVAQPVLSIDNQNSLDQQAFDEALKDAKSQADIIGSKNLKFIKKIVSISQVSSPSTSTATTKADVSESGVFKIVKAVSVTYKMW